MQKQIKVSINGKFYKLASETPEQEIYLAAQLVDSLFKEYSDATGGQVLAYDLALRVALQLALDYKKSQSMLQLNQDKIENLLVLLDQEVA